MVKIISIISAKGGVGKTTTTVNLAIVFKMHGYKTTVVDGNLTTPNLSFHFGIPYYPVTLHDVIKRKANINQAIYRHKSGVNIIPASLSIDGIYTKPRHFKRVVHQLLSRRGFILIDGAAGLGREARMAMEIADDSIVVTNPDLPSVADAAKAVKLAYRMKKNILGVIVNRYNEHWYGLSLDEIESMIDAPVLGYIPDDQNVAKSIAMKMPIVYCYPYSPASRAFKELGAELLGEEYYDKVPKKGLLNEILKLFRR